MKNSYLAAGLSQGKLTFVWVGFALLLILAAGCAGTFQEVRSVSHQPSPVEHPAVLLLGPVQFAATNLPATEMQVYQFKFQQGVEAWFAKTNIFHSVLAGTNVPPHGVMLTGTISEVEKGSAAQRFWVGMGAGQARIRGVFEIKDETGQCLEQFTARRSYLGGAGIGGADILNMEELMFRLGGTVAESVNKWAHGQKLE